MISPRFRKKGTVSTLMKRPSMTGFDLEQSIDRTDSERGDTMRDKRCTVMAKFREGDKIDFLLLHSKNWLYEWVPGTVLKFKSNISGSLEPPGQMAPLSGGPKRESTSTHQTSIPNDNRWDMTNCNCDLFPLVISIQKK